MAYRIDYQATKKVRGMEKRTASPAAMAGACFLGFLLLVSAFWPRGAAALRELIVPGDPAVTVTALEDLAENLQAGQSIQGALENFCRQATQLDPA